MKRPKGIQLGAKLKKKAAKFIKKHTNDENLPHKVTLIKGLLYGTRALSHESLKELLFKYWTFFSNGIVRTKKNGESFFILVASDDYYDGGDLKSRCELV